jgi:hypothetical protein
MPMTEAEWLACADPKPMLESLRGKASERKLRLFTYACWRQARSRLTSERTKQALEAVEVAERHADGQATLEELVDARMSPWPGINTPDPPLIEAAICYYLEVARFANKKIQRNLHLGWWSLLRDIIGNPFRPSPPLPAAVLAWNDRTVYRLAQAIYEDRQLPAGTLDTARLAILADALLDAGCDDEALIAHCRGAGPHVRGCWAVDLILGKT